MPAPINLHAAEHNMASRSGNYMKRRGFAAVSAVVLASVSLVGAPASGASDPNPCHLPPGLLSKKSLPPGTSVVACKAVGRSVLDYGLVADVPAPGMSLLTEAMFVDGAAEFEITVDSDGVISYDGDNSSEAATSTIPYPVDPPECNQNAYSTKDLKEYGRYDFYIGDGFMPAGLTKSEFAGKVADSVENIITAHNNCGMPDNVPATGSFTGYTTMESDITSSGGYYKCSDGSTDGRDGTSTWDAGNIDEIGGQIPVAQTCTWSVPSPGIKNDLVEADVRFNTDYTFTVTPNSSSCNNAYDLVSVGTHEAGHVYGLGHVSEVNYPWMTMSTASQRCDTSARTLGRGDVLGLESIY